jgi:hypothetical protein
MFKVLVGNKEIIPTPIYAKQMNMWYLKKANLVTVSGMGTCALGNIHPVRPGFSSLNQV